MDEDEQSLEVLLARATSILNKELDLEVQELLAQAINKDSDGAQIALRFLGHKMQSPIEREALQALLVLEDLVQSGGHKIKEELGKFRFLNEMIKVVSPKYLAHRSSPKVKQRVIELLFLWSIQIKDMPKIFEAYQMLKKQNIVTEDPVHVIPNYRPPTPPPPRPKDEIFDDEERSQLLRTLLQSGRPEDLASANQLIKAMVKEADKRMDFKARCSSELEAVNENANVLSEMLAHFDPNQTKSEERELISELATSCEKLRPKLFRLAGELSENDPFLNELLEANDRLTKVINEYKVKMGLMTQEEAASQSNSHSMEPRANPPTFNALLDFEAPVAESSMTESLMADHDVSLLDDHLLNLNLDSTEQSHKREASPSFDDILDRVREDMPNGSTASHPLLPKANISSSDKSDRDIDSQRTSSKKNAFSELENLTHSLIRQNLPADKPLSCQSDPKRPLNQIQKRTANQTELKDTKPSSCLQVISPTSSSAASTTSSAASSPSAASCPRPESSQSPLPPPLTDVQVSIESIEPSSLPPLTLLDKDGLKLVMHFGKNRPRPDVRVIVVTIMSSKPTPVTQVSFQAAVPKNCRIKLQPASSSSLPAYNAFAPPSVITQVVLVAQNESSHEEQASSKSQTPPVRLKYKLSYSINRQVFTEIGQIEHLFSALS